MCKQVLENFCGGLLIFSQLLKTFGATYLGKGGNCLNTNEWLFIMDTPQ
jgi:hypothetical protein